MRMVCPQMLPLAGLLLVVAAGCSAFKGRLNPENLKQIDGNKTVAIVYRTESDRLNVASHAIGGSVQQASHQQGASSLLPPVSMSTLKIVHPHPAGRPDHARVYLAFSGTTGESANGSASFWTKLASFGADSTEQEPTPFEIWAMDVPKYQIDGIIAKLQKANFFRRSKVLNSSTYLGVSLDGKGFGKDYRNVDELDALIVRVRHQGWPVGADGNPLRTRRPTPPGHGPGVNQARAEIGSYRNLPPRAHQPAPEYHPQPGHQPSAYQPHYDRPQHQPPRFQQPQSPPNQAAYGGQYGQPSNNQPQYAPPRYPGGSNGPDYQSQPAQNYIR